MPIASVELDGRLKDFLVVSFAVRGNSW